MDSSPEPTRDHQILCVAFPGVTPAPLAEVGGKAHSLMLLAQQGFQVPPGIVLTTAFFQPWFEQIQRTACWAKLLAAEPDEWSSLCRELKALSAGLTFGEAQQQALEGLREDLHALGDARFAVRSSSLEEDLPQASFAGGYETCLGVRSEDLEIAVRRCFASTLDERVLMYKRERGFDIRSPRLAVVVQQQIHSEVAGVGFSLNPLNNDYDEAVINANWGLGESVVAGRVSPDHFVLDKVGRQVVERKQGAKQLSIWVSEAGGTTEKQGYRSQEFSLNDAQLSELIDAICEIETFYQRPIDIEWSYANDQLYLLQARPITTYIPLAPRMMTQPGERRCLYADMALSSGLTINAHISPLGLDWMREGLVLLADMTFGKLDFDLRFEEAFCFCAGGRMYQNVSNVLWLTTPEQLAKMSAASDVLMAETQAYIDADRYRSQVKPPWAKVAMLKYLPRVMWRGRYFVGTLLWAILAPEHAWRSYQVKADGYKTELTGDLDYSLSLDAFRRQYTSTDNARLMLTFTMSVVWASVGAIAMVDVLVGKSAEGKALGDKLKRGFTGNIVVEMGITLFRLAKMLPPSDFDDLDQLVERINTRQMPAQFCHAWDAFMAKFGCRGPLEMDLASPRYADDPVLALKQMSLMPLDDERFDPELTHQRQVEEREQAFAALMARSGWLRRRLLRRVYHVIDLFAGIRDHPKYYMLLFYQGLRKRALSEGERLTREGRLDASEDIFDLTFDDIDSAVRDPALDLRAIRQQRTAFNQILSNQVHTFPAVIDSRGRILRPPARESKPGEYRGMAVSAGLAKGPVKVLQRPDEKPVDKGDILVVYTTDPGWTPLFVSAAAIVIEVGGALQHGAVVAREYGKPCVVGIDQLISQFEDGQQVEVDGTAGMVRLL